MTPWKKLMNKNYLGSWDLESGKELVLTIKHAYNDDVENSNGKKEKCLLVDFVEKDYKPLIVNNTNGQSIEQATGSKYIEEWAGKKITLYVTSITAFGDIVDAIRVRNYPPKDQKKFFCENCGKEIIAQNGLSAETIASYTKKKYGKSLCSDCAMKAKSEIENAKNEPDPEPEEEINDQPEEPEDKKDN